MPKERTLILNGVQIEQKIVRMAHEIHERNYLEKEILVIGITGGGNELALRIAQALEKMNTLQVVRREITLNKEKPAASPAQFNGDLRDLKGKTIVLVDDVLNSGRTLIYASKFLLDAEPKALSIATLVDRFHRRFPIRADYVGLTLSTNLKEHVHVELIQGSEAVYLE